MESPSHRSCQSVIDAVSPIAGWMILFFLSDKNYGDFCPMPVTLLVHAYKYKAFYQTFNII